jgi:hypothetical protein
MGATYLIEQDENLAKGLLFGLLRQTLEERVY